MCRCSQDTQFILNDLEFLTICWPIARIFIRGLHIWLMCMYECTDQKSLGTCSSWKFLKIRCSEVACEAILGQKQSCRIYMVHRVLHHVFSCISSINGHLLSQLTLDFLERKQLTEFRKCQKYVGENFRKNSIKLIRQKR